MIAGFRLRRGGAGRADNFLRAEEGSLSVFALFLFVLMVMMGGIAVDLMRAEATRVTLQQTLDRATLAAAALDQDLDPESVVRDYFDKAGLSDQLEDVNVDEGLNYRNVTVDAKAVSPSVLMHMIGVDELEMPAASQAEQRITNVEIALVLDVSGSMQNTPSRITNLKLAAREFVDTVLARDTENKISIALVPYNGQVNLGPQLFGRFLTTFPHTTANSHCVDLPNNTFDALGLSTLLPLPQTPHIDSWSGTTQSTSYVSIQGPTINAQGLFSNVWCQPNAANFVRPFTNNATQLRNQIDGLVAVGATSIDLGMKWGTTLLDPGFRTVNSILATAGLVPGFFSGRPSNYFDPDTMKVIVLMTDGEHFTRERVNDLYRVALSPVWLSSADNMLSIHHPTANGTSLNKFWVPHRNEWRLTAWNSTGALTNTRQLTWAEVWARARVSWVAWQLYARPLSGGNSSLMGGIYTTWMNNFVSYVPTTTMDDNLSDICTRAKAQGIIIYGIAFEAPDHGQNVIQDCASQPSSNYYIETYGPGIIQAFRLISANISQLRLTQ
jgi:Flp pilus assembly protein TadG